MTGDIERKAPAPPPVPEIAGYFVWVNGPGMKLVPQRWHGAGGPQGQVNDYWKKLDLIAVAHPLKQDELQMTLDALTLRYPAPISA